MVVPSFPALFADTALQVLSNERPVFRAILQHHASDDLILFPSPGSLHEDGVEHFLPSVKALNISSVLEERSDFFPITRL